jgi:hypothetical protein
MASEQELEGLHIIELAVLCQRAADNPSLDDDIRANAAAFGTGMGSVGSARNTTPARFQNRAENRAR